MAGNEVLEVTLILWGSVAGLFVLAGFLTGEWVACYRDLREWLHERQDRSSGSGSGTNHPMPRAS